SVISTETFWGKPVTVDLEDSISAPMYYFGILKWQESNLIKFLIKNLQEDDVFYDIGASYGFYSVLAAEIITEGKIHAFEPSDRMFNILGSQFEESSNVTLNKSAVSDTTGKINFFDGSKFGDTEFSTTVEQTAEMQKLQGRTLQRKQIESTTLDEYTSSGHTPPSFIKIDVEGAEPKVIKGGQKTIKENKPVISMEVREDNDETNLYENAINLLLNLNYTLCTINKNGQAKRKNPDKWKELVRNDFDNFLFIHHEK
ncbi:MAG: FkbM family methyltransferase, partial [Candidatus Magasanikbacteria bacterium]